ncbi:hypothetical protein [Actinomadura miaoliensis]|uniref:Phage portal protein n=1 Tax=Actinomadura miaoliensis TaxID=430685 RepID=A0ABP7V529_9ACTN
MPLPTGGPWPPATLQPIYDMFHVLDAWYRGDGDRLSTVYGQLANKARPVNRPSQYRGGIVGMVARWFWGQPTPAGQKRTKLHVPIASDIATMSSDLLFSEPPNITVPTPATQARIDEMVPDLQATLLQGSEVGSALGGYYLRAVWDRDVAPRPWLGAVHADAAVPTFRWGRLYAVTFWRTIEELPDGRCLVHLERHEPGWILHGLYRGDPGMLGEQLPLTAHPETEHLEPAIETGLTRCTAVYVPNMKPNRDWRTYPPGQDLGRSDYAGPVMGLMDALDEAWTSWMRDLRLAKARLIVPSSYLQSLGRGQGAAFDPDQELYEGLETLGEGDRMEISAQQFAIRVQEHRDTQAELLAAILRAAGYSAQSFGLSGEVAITATEVAAKERRSLVTRGKKALYTAPALADAIEMLLQLEASLFGSSVVPERPDIEFGDSVSPDIMQLAQTAELMHRAEAVSTETLVRMLHPDWDDPAVQAEVARIRDESGALTADPLGQSVTDAVRATYDAPADEDPDAAPADGE